MDYSIDNTHIPSNYSTLGMHMGDYAQGCTDFCQQNFRKIGGYTWSSQAPLQMHLQLISSWYHTMHALCTQISQQLHREKYHCQILHEVLHVFMCLFILHKISKCFILARPPLSLPSILLQLIQHQFGYRGHFISDNQVILQGVFRVY